MQNTQYMYICVIIISILNVISTTTCVMSLFILTYHGFHFLKDLWPKLSSLCSCLNLWYNYVCVMSRKCLMWGSRSLEPLLNFSTSFWLDGILLSHQNSYTSPFTTSMSFISECGNLPMKDQKSISPESICSLLEQYLHSVLISNPTSLDVGSRSRRALVLLFMINCDNTWWAALRSLEQYLFPIVLNTSTKLLSNMRTWFRTVSHLYP